MKEIEWILIIASLRYFMGRETIQSATFPTEIIKNYYQYFNEKQKELLVNELQDYLANNEYFGNKNIDHPIWMKFLKCLDEKQHFKILAIDDTVSTCFKVNGKIYPKDIYLNNPQQEIYVPESNVKKYL